MEGLWWFESKRVTDATDEYPVKTVRTHYSFAHIERDGDSLTIMGCAKGDYPESYVDVVIDGSELIIPTGNYVFQNKDELRVTPASNLEFKIPEIMQVDSHQNEVGSASFHFKQVNDDISHPVAALKIGRSTHDLHCFWWGEGTYSLVDERGSTIDGSEFQFFGGGNLAEGEDGYFDYEEEHHKGNVYKVYGFSAGNFSLYSDDELAEDVKFHWKEDNQIEGSADIRFELTNGDTETGKVTLSPLL